ncbi:MAG TPA: helix-turn-helix transcriptional regulator [Opitutaceae bacterium]
MTVKLLGQRLRELRQRHHLTQEEFAELAGLNYKFYQQVEAGRKKQLWLETVERLAAGFGLEAWQLISPTLPSSSKVVLASSKSEYATEKTERPSMVAEKTKKYSAKPKKRRSKS